MDAPDPETESFARWVERGDPRDLEAALAAVAPGLFDLAVHLTGDPATAEDALQDALLAALARAGDFDPSRPLRAWLAGFLANCARAARRRARRAASADAPLDALAAPDPEPARRAELSELEALLADELERVPPLQRAALVLRLRNGLSPAEIAHALGRSPSTVRTQLARGLYRLRERLPAALLAQGALALDPASPSLDAVLARVLERAPPPPALPVPPVPAIALAGALAVKKAVAAAALVALLLVAWLAVDAPPAAPAERAVPLAAAAPAAAPVERPPAPPASVAEPRAPEREREPVPAPPPPAEPAARADAPSGEPTLPPMAGFEVLVLDEYGNTLSGARVSVAWMRTAEEPRSSIALQLEPATTDLDGLALLRIPRHLGDQTVARVTLAVEHPECVSAEARELELAEGSAEVVLEYGALLVVSGWIGSPGRPVLDVRPRLDDRVRLDGDGWFRLADGRLATARVGTGEHFLALTHRAPGSDGAERTWHSDVTRFAVRPRDRVDLALELHPAVRVEGRLDAAVPRPVTGGRALLATGAAGARGSELVLFRSFDAEVRPDGTFTVDDVPRGEIEVIALADGWSSAPVCAAVEAGAEPPSPRCGQQRFEVAGETASVEVAMQRTAELEVLVTDGSGEPLEGAAVLAWPNVHWGLGYSNFFVREGALARTDARGVARLVDLPALPGEALAFEVTWKGWRPEEGRTLRADELRPGEVARAEVRLRP